MLKHLLITIINFVLLFVLKFDIFYTNTKNTNLNFLITCINHVLWSIQKSPLKNNYTICITVLSVLSKPLSVGILNLQKLLIHQPTCNRLAHACIFIFLFIITHKIARWLYVYKRTYGGFLWTNSLE